MNTETQELLTLCGFEPDEIEQQRHRIETTFERLNLGAEDMVQAVSRINTNFFCSKTVNRNSKSNREISHHSAIHKGNGITPFEKSFSNKG